MNQGNRNRIEWSVQALEDRPRRLRGNRRRQRVKAHKARRYGKYVETRIMILGGDAAWAIAVNHN